MFGTDKAIYARPSWSSMLAQPPGSAKPLAQSQVSFQGQPIQTTIQPAGVFTPTMTQQQINQQRAAAQVQANPRSAMKQFSAPGLSQSAGMLSAAMPQITEARAQAALAPAQVGLQDAADNAAQILKGQVAQTNQGFGLADLLLKQSALADQQRLDALLPLLSYFGQAF